MSTSLGEGFTVVAQKARILDASASGEAYINSAQKRELDRIGVGILRPLAAPILSLARVSVFLEDGSPTTVGLQRIGKDGVPFNQKKVRSMVTGTELLAHRSALKTTGDERVTTVGRFIRKYSIDELPQLENVREGKMSLVGPRPIPECEYRENCAVDPSFGPAYTPCFPGLTGLEQINGRADLSQATRIELVKQYLEEACLALDIDILQKTARLVLTADGAY